MRLKPYWNYFKYVMEHKSNVFIECWKDGLYIHAFTHDMSKFRPSEFIPYARYFYIDKEKYKEDFEKAWKLHYTRNKHHWNHWNSKELSIIPSKYIDQMICDWSGMSRKFGGSNQEFYLNNYNKIKIIDDSRFDLELKLGLLDHYNAPISESCSEYWETLGLTIDRYNENWDKDNRKYENPKECFNDLHIFLCEKYNVDLYEKVMDGRDSRYEM